MEQFFQDEAKLIYGTEWYESGQERMLPCAAQVSLRIKAVILLAAERFAC